MNLNLENKTAIVTASTAGIGFAIAEALLKEGASVLVNGRTKERVDQALAKLGDGARGVVADLSTADGAAKLFAAAPSADILVNNLGVYEGKALEKNTVEDFARMFDINVLSGVRLSQHYLPRMKKANWGRILFIASESGVNIPPDMIPYGVSKAAQIALSRGLAETTGGTGVTVNSILPGPTFSEGIAPFLGATPKEKFIADARPTSLLRRFATVEEVANLVVYMASPLSAATNGAAMRVEGGLLRHC